MSRIWTDEQLAEMAKRTIDKAFDAIDAGEPQKAKELVQLMYDQFVHLHDGYMVWIAGLLTWIYERHGAEGAFDAEREAHAKEAKLVFAPPEKTDFQFIVEKMSAELQGHVHQHMALAEDDEKVVLTNTPCGSGGRLIQMGGYDPEVGLARIAEPSDLTFNTPDYPIYCLHCPLFNRNAIDDMGDFLFINNPPGDGSSCQFIFYKDKKDIPEEYYKRLGREKPLPLIQNP
ncbi:MAG: hypothetical protein LBS91_03780 [Clostridiales Family XIII bacterium]|jgi:hypothetical protein|nr:hypothetical protein [Clostridiales Family XIII bacterium]